MSAPLIILVTLIYAGVAIDQAMQGSWGGAVMFAGYALANCGVLAVLQ